MYEFKHKNSNLVEIKAPNDRLSSQSCFELVGALIRSPHPVLHVETDSDIYNFMRSDDNAVLCYSTKKLNDVVDIISKWVQESNNKRPTPLQTKIKEYNRKYRSYFDSNACSKFVSFGTKLVTKEIAKNCTEYKNNKQVERIVNALFNTDTCRFLAQSRGIVYKLEIDHEPYVLKLAKKRSCKHKLNAF